MHVTIDRHPRFNTILIGFDSKPPQEIISRLKGAGWRWGPNIGKWWHKKGTMAFAEQIKREAEGQNVPSRSATRPADPEPAMPAELRTLAAGGTFPFSYEIKPAVQSVPVAAMSEPVQQLNTAVTAAIKTPGGLDKLISEYVPEPQPPVQASLVADDVKSKLRELLGL